MRCLHATLLRLGVVLVGCALLTWALLEIAVRHELAQSPGEDSLGVAVLGMLFGFPMLGFLGFGILALLASAVVFAWNVLIASKQPN